MWVKKARRGASCSTRAMIGEVGVGGVGLGAQGVENEEVEAGEQGNALRVEVA